MKLLTSTSVAFVASLMLVTPTVTAMPRQQALEDAEVMNMDALLDELDHDPALRDQLFGFGGKQNLISKLAGGGIKGSIANKIAHRYLRSYGKKYGVDLAGIVDGVINPDGPDVNGVYASLKKSQSLAKITQLLDNFGGAEAINRVLDRFGGAKALASTLESLVQSKLKKH